MLKVSIQMSSDPVGGSVGKDCVVMPTYWALHLVHVITQRTFLNCFTANSVFNLEVVECTFGGALNVWFGIEGSTCQAAIVTFFDQWRYIWSK